MIAGKTKSGFEFKIDEQSLNDMEFIENLKAVDKGDVTVLPEILESLLGKEQKKKMYDHVRNDVGRVPMELVTAELEEIFKASKEVKN